MQRWAGEGEWLSGPQAERICSPESKLQESPALEEIVSSVIACRRELLHKKQIM